MFRINKYQISLATGLLANKQYRIRFNGNKVVILSSFEMDKVEKLLNQNFITFKVI